MPGYPGMDMRPWKRGSWVWMESGGQTSLLGCQTGSVGAPGPSAAREQGEVQVLLVLGFFPADLRWVTEDPQGLGGCWRP